MNALGAVAIGFMAWFLYVYSVKMEMKLAYRFVRKTFSDIEKGDLPFLSESVDDNTRQLIDKWPGKDSNIHKIEYYGTSAGGDSIYLPYEVVFGDGTVLYCKIEIYRTTLLSRDIRIREILI